MSTTTDSVAADTHTKVVHGREYITTTWTVAGYRLVRVTEAGNDRANWSVENDDYSAPSLFTIQSYSVDSCIPTYEYGVNWSAQGTKSVTDARAYAQAIVNAAAAAEAFGKIRTENANANYPAMEAK